MPDDSVTAVPSAPRPVKAAPSPGDSRLAARLQRNIAGEILFDRFSRGRYATDASIYQVEPIGVVVPKSADDIAAAIAIAREEGAPVLPRGGGTSQCGQTVGRALVVDTSKHLRGLVAVDAEARTAIVEPGLTVDQLNRQLKAHGLFFPVDVSTGNRATIGGMAGNNSCGARSLRYGNMMHSVRGIDAILADGTAAHFGEVPDDLAAIDGPPALAPLVGDLRAIAEGVVAELSSDRWPKLLRRVGGYNIDSLVPQRIEGLKRNRPGHNLAHLLVGSEGTLGFFTRLHLDLQPLPKAKVLGVCHFPTFYRAMELTRHIVALGPAAVELVDRTMIELGREIPAFRPVLDRVVRGEPDALLLVEFAGDDLDPERERLARLGELLADLGLPGSVVEVTDPALQTQVWEVRKQGLNIMMSMKGDGKPVSFIEDCAVPLDRLAEYTDRLTRIFERYGTRGTWYAHASVGCLHVRPILNMKEPDGAKKMRAIAEEAFAIVREYKGSHSGEHGDGLVRSEFHEPMYGAPIVRAFERVKDRFDPQGLFNPGKIVRSPRMDDRSLFRYAPGYAALPFEPALDWSAWGGFPQAVEMCNNNGACRKADVGVMCPSYRVTGDEQHLTRGRANTLRLALTGQLGPDALISDEMRETLSLCVGCKGCKRECPTGVDMARMKIEVLHHWQKRRGLRPGERVVAYLPRYAPWAARFPWLANARDLIPGAARIAEPLLGFSAKRAMPAWRRDPFRPPTTPPKPSPGREVVLLIDTFNTYFEPENAYAAERVLTAAGYAVHFPTPPDGSRPLCCGRTFLAAGLVDEARAEAKRMLAGLKPHLEAGRPIIGLEPSCLLTLRDELLAMLPGEETEILAAKAFLLEEFLAAEERAKRLSFPLRSLPERRALVHGHCHQKAFAAMGAVETTLRLIPGLAVETIESSCCGMAGAFGYQAATYEVSMAMAEQSLLPAVRAAGDDTLIVADGTSCRHQIQDGTGREALHVARVLERALV